MLPQFEDRLTEGLEGAKWLAIVLMALSHAGMALGGDLSLPAFWVGRWCAPIFCYLIVARLAEKPAERSVRYLVRLTAWSVVAQWPFSLYTAAFGFHFNVLVTLALGVAAIWLWQQGYRVIAGAGSLALLVPAGLFDMGLIAPPIMLLGYLAYRHSSGLAAFAVAAGYAAAHIYARPHDLVAPVLCLMVPVVVAVCGSLPARPIRLPGWLFYAFYPAHLALIVLILGPCPVPGES